MHFPGPEMMQEGASYVVIKLLHLVCLGRGGSSRRDDQAVAVRFPPKSSAYMVLFFQLLLKIGKQTSNARPVTVSSAKRQIL
eukprot:868904-Pelagomonas_calceolata.AAC.5